METPTIPATSRKVERSVVRRRGFRRLHDPHDPLPALGAGSFEHEITVLFGASEIDHLRRPSAFATEDVFWDSLARPCRNRIPQQLSLGGEDAFAHGFQFIPRAGGAVDPIDSFRTA